MSPKATNTASDQIRDVIAALPSAAFSAAEMVERLPDVSRELLDQVLLRMVQDGKIGRLQRGFYLRNPEPIDPEEEERKANAVVQPAATTTPIATSGAAPKIANLIWTTADEVLRGDFKPHEYGSVILPFTVMRRLDCVLAPTKAKVLEAAEKYATSKVDPALIFRKATNDLRFWNTSKFDFAKLANDATGLQKNLLDYVGGFSENIRDIFDFYKTVDLINSLAQKKLLLLLVQKFASVDLHPDVVSNADMGQAFEELIRRFSEQSNETAGEHYTPRDAIRLAVELLFATDEDPTLSKNERIVKLYDPTAGTGGMLSVAEEHLKQFNSSVTVLPYGQELNGETYAICKADMLIKGQDIDKIVVGNTLSNDAFPNEKFDYMLSNPPYGVDWKKVKSDVESEAKHLGLKGRFGAGLPRISDGQMLFLLHLVSKMHPKGSSETSRIAIIMNGSPLFSGGAGSGESEIRRFVLENDLLEAIVGLPTDMFYNTGISTYIWILSNNKETRRAGMVQLIDGSARFGKMRRSLGSKRRELRAEDIGDIVQDYGAFAETENSKILPTTAFGYRTIVIERPLRLNFRVDSVRLARLLNEPLLTTNGIDLQKLQVALTDIGSEVFTSRQEFINALDLAIDRAELKIKGPQFRAIVAALSERDADADICLDAKKRPEPDSELRDTENVPLTEDIDAYFQREVAPFVSDGWIDEDKTKVGYDFPFSRHFYRYKAPRPLKAIDSDLTAITEQIVQMLSKGSA